MTTATLNKTDNARKNDEAHYQMAALKAKKLFDEKKAHVLYELEHKTMDASKDAVAYTYNGEVCFDRNADAALEVISHNEELKQELFTALFSKDAKTIDSFLDKLAIEII